MEDIHVQQISHPLMLTPALMSAMGRKLPLTLAAGMGGKLTFPGSHVERDRMAGARKLNVNRDHIARL